MIDSPLHGATENRATRAPARRSPRVPHRGRHAGPARPTPRAAPHAAARHATGALATTRRLAGALAAASVAASTPADAGDRLLFALAGAVLLALSAAGTLTLARATRRAQP